MMNTDGASEQTVALVPVKGVTAWWDVSENNEQWNGMGSTDWNDWLGFQFFIEQPVQYPDGHLAAEQVVYWVCNVHNTDGHIMCMVVGFDDRYNTNVTVWMTSDDLTKVYEAQQAYRETLQKPEGQYHDVMELTKNSH